MCLGIHAKHPLFSSNFIILIKLVFSGQIFKKSSNFTKIRPPVARLFHKEGQTDSHGEADIRFPNFAKPPKIPISQLHCCSC